MAETKRVRYLLGLSSSAEREHIESEYFEDDNAFQEMLTAEDDLIDAYARSELAGEERRRFEKNFVSSLRGRDRVQFARVFEGAVSPTRSVETKLPGPLLDIFKTFQSPDLSRTATIAAVIVFLAVLAWLVVDRRRMTNELRELRAESAELSKRTEALQRSGDTERTRTAEIAAQLADLRAQPEKAEKLLNTQDASLGKAFKIRISALPVLGRKFENLLGPHPGTPPTTVRGTAKDPQGNVVIGATVTLTDSARNFTRTQSTNENGVYVFSAIQPGIYSIEVAAPGFKRFSASGLAALVDTPGTFDVQLEVGNVTETVSVIAGRDALINTSDAMIGNTFESRRLTELPLNSINVVGLLSLQPGVTRNGYVNGGRSDQAGITLDGVDATIRIPSSNTWIRFQLTLETAAIHEDYRITLSTADGRTVTTENWSEPLTPKQTIIDTPAISVSDLTSGDYVLLLMGKGPDGSFVKVAEYFFKLIKF